MPITSLLDNLNALTGPDGSFNEVVDFASLPDATISTGELYYVTTTTGIVLINRKLSGWYRSDGATWIYAGDLQLEAFETKFTPAGDIAATNLQDAVTEVRDDTDTKLTAKANTSAISAVGFSGEYADILSTPVLSAVALSGEYSDLLNSPALSAVALSGEYADILNTPALAAVALSGAYADLSGTPVLAAVALSGAYADLSGTPVLAAVALSGDYNDLSNLPALAPVATSGVYSDLTGTPVFGLDYNSIEDEVESTTTSNTYVQKASLSLTGVSAGDYYVSINILLRSSSNTKSVGVQVELDDTTQLHEASTEGTDYTQKGMSDIVTLTSGNHTIDVDFRIVDNGITAFIDNVRIIVWRVS